MPDFNHYLMSQIVLEGEFHGYRCFDNEDRPFDPMRLEGLGKINVFVGANNSGKSRLIRGIARAKKIVFEPSEGIQFLGVPFRVFHRLFDLLLGKTKSMQQYGINQMIANLGWGNYVRRVDNTGINGLAVDPNPGNSKLSNALELLQSLANDAGRNARGSAWQEVIPPLESALASVERALEIETAAQQIQRVYIPTLRTMRELGSKDLLINRTSLDYKMEAKDIFTGQSLYADVERLLRGDLKDREHLRSFEKWISEVFFDDRPVALIPRHDHTTLTVKIGNEPEKAIHDLGDGIQSLLILTFPLFRWRDKHVLAFIEEPELFLHPWLQRVFLETLSQRFPKHQYFLTTHSNHFLDLTLDVDDVSVYTLEKHVDLPADVSEAQVKFHVHQVSRDQRKPLELLGVRNSSVLLSNCTIWVEGVTDRRYIAHWLKLYQSNLSKQEGKSKVFKEDFHYSFVEYGGGNITHFSFLDDDEEPTEKRILVDRLCAKLFLITDADVDPISRKRGAKTENSTPPAGDEQPSSDPKQSRKALLAKRLDDRYYCLESREIENLLSPKVLQSVLIAYGEENPPQFNHDRYRSARLGEFIDKQLSEKRNRKGSYGGEYGVLNGKVAFCAKAIESTTSWDDVSEEAQKLVKKIHDFISSMNVDVTPPTLQ